MRYELSDDEWTAIKPMLPNKPRGVPRVNDRRVLNGIFWVLRSGAPWRDLPNNFGPYTTCYNRFVRWRRAGVWSMIMSAVAGAHDTSVQMIDTSIVRVHQHGSCVNRNRRQSMGWSRAGLTSKIHAVVDTNGLPVRVALTGGEAHDNRLAGRLLSRLKSGAMLLADRGYDADWIRALAAEKGAWANIPPRRNRTEPICFSPYLYRARNLVERFFNKIKHCRRVATRYDKLAANYLAFVQLASIRLWLRVNESTPMSANIIRLLPDDERALLECYVAGSQHRASFQQLFDTMEVPTDAVPDRLQIAVAQILLHHVQDSLPQWDAITNDGKLVTNRRRHKRHKGARLHFTPRLLFSINWATSGPGFEWPEAYHVTYVPGLEKYIFTASRDGADALGCEDHAIGAADRTDDLQRAAKKVLTSYWRHQVDEWDQGRWESCIQEGLIEDRTANAWAEAVWHGRCRRRGNRAAHREGRA